MKKVVQLLKKFYLSFQKKSKAKEDASFFPEIKLTFLEETRIDDFSVVSQDFKDINCGDIIFAKRKSQGKSSFKLRNGHQLGPFLVLEKTENQLLCLYGSSNCEKKDYQYRFIIDPNGYNGLTKPTCFYLNEIKIITQNLYKKKLDTLNDFDKVILQKRLNILARKNDHLKKYVQMISLEEGDIFTFNHDFYIAYKIENNKMEAIYLSIDSPTSYQISSLCNNYYIHFNRILKIENQKFLFQDAVSNETFLILLEHFKSFLEKEKRNALMQRGSVIRYKENLIYIYSQESLCYLGYRIADFSKDDNYPITIHQKQYSAFFDSIYEINKEDDFTYITTVSDEEATHNKIVKKIYNRRKTEINYSKEIHKKKIEEGVMVEDYTLNHTKYVVLQRNGNELLMFNPNQHIFNYLDIWQVDFYRKLKQKEFQNLLLYLRKNPSNYRFIEEEQLALLLKKYSKKE